MVAKFHLHNLLVSFRIFFFDFQKNVNFQLRCFAIFVNVLDDFDGDRLTIAATTHQPVTVHTS